MAFARRIGASSAAIIILAGVFALLASNGIGQLARAQTSQEVKEQLSEKNEALRKIREEQQRLQAQLDGTLTTQSSLKKELKQIDYHINQIDLGIKASEITIDTLSLEMKELEFKISDTESDIEKKRRGIAQFVRAIDQQDAESPIVIFLKHTTLAEGFGEVQLLSNLTAGLSNELESLSHLEGDLSHTLDESQAKKKEREQEYASLTVQKQISDTQKKSKQTLLTDTKNQETKYRLQLEQRQREQAAIEKEIEDLEAQLRKQINFDTLPKGGTGFFTWPIIGRISQGYGATAFAKYHYGSKWHNGVDIVAAIGTPIQAAEAGTVRAVWDQDVYCRKGAYGKFIAIEHPSGLVTLYAHLSAFAGGLKVGDTVNRGQVIGYVGTTGNSTGSHLHFTVYTASTFRIDGSRTCGPKMPFGGDVNPMNYL